MDVMATIQERTSYRGLYKDTPVPREDLKKILEAGLFAPSGCNKQTTSLIAVDDPAMLEKLYEVIKPSVGTSAPAMICVLTQKIIAYRDRCYQVQDYAAAIENMLLAIVGLGYQSCWVEGHVTDVDQIGRQMADILGVPEEYDLVCFLPIGVADEPVKKIPRTAFEKRAWFNGYHGSYEKAQDKQALKSPYLMEQPLIEEYVNQHILPHYDTYDKGHNGDHIHVVIENSLKIAQDYEVDRSMVFVISAYHDIGIKYGRNDHHITSATYLREDTGIKDFFTEDQITVMSDAIEDHRASNDYEPRTIYGKIISEADRDIDPETIVYRTMEFSKSHFPDYSFEEHVQRTCEHLEEKYGENGYLKLWLETTANRNGLRALRNLLKNKEELRRLCKTYA